MDLNLINETINSNISKFIPINIKNYILKIYNYEKNNFYLNQINNSYFLINKCDYFNEEKLFYENIYNELILTYKPIINKYNFLSKNYNDLKII